MVLFCFVLFFKFWGLFVCLFIYLLLCWVFISARGLSPIAASGGHAPSRCAGLPSSRPLLPRSTGPRHAQAQQLWPTGPAAPRHAGSSQTRVRTHVPCIGRQTPNHCATREAPYVCFDRAFWRPHGDSLITEIKQNSGRFQPGICSWPHFMYSTEACETTDIQLFLTYKHSSFT